MKKGIVGSVAVGAIVGAMIALRPVVRRAGQKMSEHCEQMAAQFAGRGEMSEKMRARCEQMAAQFRGRGEAVQQ